MWGLPSIPFTKLAPALSSHHAANLATCVSPSGVCRKAEGVVPQDRSNPGTAVIETVGFGGQRGRQP